MKIYLIAGEKSGDQHAGALLNQLLKIIPDLEARCVGGESLKNAGGTLFLNYSEINFMGISDVVLNIIKIKSRINSIQDDIEVFMPDAIIHIDASSLNMRIAKFAKKLGIKTLYYIAPKIWAWNTKRVYELKKIFSKIFVIFPFEKKFYLSYEVPVSYAGNPSLEAISKYHLVTPKSALKAQYIALLPGSRPQEVEKTLPIYVELVKRMPSRQFRLAALSVLPINLYAPALTCSNLELIMDSPYDLLSGAEAAVVVSGTATLETALFNVPQVVCYRTSALTAFVGKLVLKIPFISLVNLVAEKEVVTELLQSDFSAKNVEAELLKIVSGGSRRAQMLKDYAAIKESLGHPNASATAAREIADFLGY